MFLPNPNLSYGYYDWTASGYKNNKSPLSRHGFVGVLKNNIYGKWFADATQATHGDIQYYKTGAKFRYFPYYKKGCIFWTDNLIEKNKEFIEIAFNFFKLPLKHHFPVKDISCLMEMCVGPVPNYKYHKDDF